MHLRRFSFLLIPACAAWIGCAGEPGTSSELNDGQSPVTEGTPTKGDGTWMGESLAEGCDPDGGTLPPDAVLVTKSTRYHTAVGVAVRNEDMSASPPEVLVPNGASFTRVTGSAAPGGWQFTGVPSGPYYLKSGSTYIVTDERQVELGNNRLGRADTVFSEHGGTPLQLNLVNLAPWTPWLGTTQPGSSLQLVSAEVDLFGGVDLFEEVPDGQTHVISNQAQMWSSTGNIPVFEADKGDRLYVNQLNQLDAGTLPDGGVLGYSAVVRSVEMGAFDFVPDGTTPMPVSGVMQPVPMSEFSMEWRLPEYTRRASEVHPSATPSTPYFAITPAAHGLPNGHWVGYSGELLTMSLPRAASFDLSRRLSYGNPFPSTWSMVGIAQYSFRTLQPIPDGTGNQFYLTGSLLSYDRLENLVAGPVQPRVSPPRDLSIDGVPASVAREVGSNSPLISWQPPTTGSPTAYRVTIYEFDPENFFGIAYTRFYVPGSATQVRLPPGTLKPGAILYLRVAAMDAPNYEVERAPFTTIERLPYSTADAISSFFTTP